MNAAALRAFDERASKVGEDLWPGLVTIDGQEYPVNLPKQAWIPEVGEAGSVMQGPLRCWIRKEVLPVAPEEMSTLIYQGLEFKILKVLGKGEDATWRLECEVL